jgi:Xaa-Pro aminopeptidase
MDHAGRLRSVQARLSSLEVDALLVTNLTNVRYLTGFVGTNGQVLVTASSPALFLSDPRYAARATAFVQGAEVAIYPHKLTDVLPERLTAEGIEQLGVEAQTMTIAQRDELDAQLEEVSLVPVAKVVEDLRRTKDAAEIAQLRAAAQLADDAFERVLDRLAPGATERDVALEIEVTMRRAGADGVSFEPIVGSGPLSSHIHHYPTERSFEKGDLVLLDFGCKLDGYCSDLTRTVVLGPATDEQREQYELVLAAQAAGLRALAVGAPAATVDAAARAVIDGAGRADEFGHGLGHGVGLEVHEAPTLNKVSEDVLAANDVVTIEPGVYSPGAGGVRIEDCVVVTEGGAEVLGSAPKDVLMEL